jgi:glyoxylase-like metal-dependent hydrolase (beta-lactamase superfamily II)
VPPLFPGGVGNTFGSKENFASLINDVQDKLFDRLPDETWVHPGHGNDTTLGKERPSLPEWRARLVRGTGSVPRPPTKRGGDCWTLVYRKADLPVCLPRRSRSRRQFVIG